MKFCGFNSWLPRGFGKVVLVSFGAKCEYESPQRGGISSLFHFSLGRCEGSKWDYWDALGAEWGRNGAGGWIHFWRERQRGGMFPTSCMAAWLENLDQPLLSPVVTQPGWLPVCPVPQDLGICGTALWAVQRLCSCFSQVLVCLLTFQFPSWTQMDLFGLISREALPDIAES